MRWMLPRVYCRVVELMLGSGESKKALKTLNKSLQKARDLHDRVSVHQAAQAGDLLVGGALRQPGQERGIRCQVGVDGAAGRRHYQQLGAGCQLQAAVDPDAGELQFDRPGIGAGATG